MSSSIADTRTCLQHDAFRINNWRFKMIIFGTQVVTFFGAYLFYMSNLWINDGYGLNPLFALPVGTVMILAPYAINALIPARNTRRGRR